MRWIRALLLVPLAPLWGCASSASPPPPSGRPFGDVRRLAIVVAGPSRFTVVEHTVEPGRTVDEVLRWTPDEAILRPFAALVLRRINELLGLGQAAEAASSVIGVPAASLVAAAFTRTLQASGGFDELRRLEREPIGADELRVDAIVRVMVPTWGLVRVQDGSPALLSGFADARAQMVTPGTGVVRWENDEDVTQPDRLPLETFTRDRQFARHELLAVLERAGQRLANELLYARGPTP